MGRAALGGQRVEHSPSERRRPDDQQHLLGREDDDAKEPGEGGGPARDTIYPDPLAPPGRSIAHERHVELEGVQARDLPVGINPRERGVPADQLRVRQGPVRGSAGAHHERLQEARLPRRIRAPDKLGARPERGGQHRVAAEAAERDGGQHRAGRGREPRSRGGRYEVVRTGMTTCV